MEIGPALPPHLAKRLSSSKEEKSTDDEQKQSNTTAGEERKLSLQTEDKSDSDEEESYGPTLPPGFQKNKETVSRTRVIGPMRPQFDTMLHRPSITTKANESSDDDDEDDDDDDDDDDIIGPRPPTSAEIDAGLERTKMDIEARSQAKRDQMSGKKDTKPKRETWMTELPPELSKNFGLGPRKFRNRALEIGDQSVWTDTAADKARKSKEGDKGSKRGSSDDGPVRTPWELARDQQMNSQVEHHNKRHRGESLMDMHTKKLEKQKEEDKNKSVERRPFDRDKDLNVPGMSDGQKKSIIHKSKELGSRFHHSKSGSSFL